MMKSSPNARRSSGSRLWIGALLAVALLLLAACATATPTQPIPQQPTPAQSATSSAQSPVLGPARPESTGSTPSAAPTTQPPAVTVPPSVSPSPQPAASAAAPANQASAEALTYKGLPTGYTPEGYPYLGDIDAPVTMEEYTDYLCPFCSRHVAQTMPALLDEYVAAGQMLYVFYDMPLESLHPNAPEGHAAGLCVAQQDLPLFWAMHDELFARQSEWNRLPDPSEFLASVAKEVGADEAAYEACMATGQPAQRVAESVAMAQSLGFTGTPSFRFTRRDDGKTFTLVGAQPLEIFQQYLDAILAGEDPPEGQGQQAGEQKLPIWATAEGLAADPKRPGYNLAGDSYKGSLEADLTVIEFTDFQCPPCRQHALEVQPALDQALVDTGEVLWVHKHLPLPMHPQAEAASVAAECAGDQGKFWEMNDLLFEKQSAWGVDEPQPVLTGLAKELGLDVERFGACLEDPETLARVKADLSDAQGVVNSTPSFVILFGDQGGLLRGSRPADQFETLLRQLQAQARGEPAPAGVTPSAQP